MKQIIFFMLLSFSIFAEWELVNYVDEFGDDKKENYVITHDYESEYEFEDEYGDTVSNEISMSISKVKTNFLKRDKSGLITKSKDLSLSYSVSILTPNFIGTFKNKYNETTIKLKNEKNEIMSFGAYSSRDGWNLLIKPEENKKFIDFIKKSEKLKIIFKDYKGFEYLIIFNVDGFKEIEEQLVTSIIEY